MRFKLAFPILMLITASALTMVRCQDNRREYPDDGNPQARLLFLDEGDGNWQEEKIQRKDKNGKRSVTVYQLTWVGEPIELERLKQTKRIVCRGKAAFGQMQTSNYDIMITFGQVKRGGEAVFDYRSPLFSPFSTRIDDQSLDIYIDGPFLVKGDEALTAYLKNKDVTLVSDNHFIRYTFYESRDDLSSVVGVLTIPYKK